MESIIKVLLFYVIVVFAVIVRSIVEFSIEGSWKEFIKNFVAGIFWPILIILGFFAKDGK